MFDLKRVFFLLLCAGLLLGAVPSQAAVDPAAPLVAVVVDVQRILDESQAAKSVQKQLETQRAKFQTEIENEENGLRQAEQDLSKAHDQLTADAYSDREQQLRQRFSAVERHVEARRKVLDKAFSDSMNTVHENLQDVVTAVAHEHGANLVLIKQQVLWTDKALDLTDEVLTKLNAKLPQITVKMAPEENEGKSEEKPSK